MNAAEITIDPRIFNEIYFPHLENMSRTQIFYGGSSSGKSVFLSQRAVADVLNGGRNYLVCRAVGRTCRRSVFNEIVKVMADWELGKFFKINLTDETITCANDYQILFSGLDDVEKLNSITPKRGVITDTWIEEATEIRSNSDIKKLYKRHRGGSAKYPKRLTLSFNPILKSHHIYKTYFAPIGWEDKQTTYKVNSLSIQKTWYIHNRFLTQGDVDDLLGEDDSYFRDVYTYGNWGVLGNVIFTNWEVADLSEMRDQFTNRRNGLDFGFSNDPAALVVSHYDKKKKTIYIYDEFYELGLTNDVLADDVKKIVGSDYVVCDSAEPKSIAELNQYGVSAVSAKKGRDSVVHGIQWLQQQKIIIDKTCINTHNEFQQYKWKENRYGVAMRRPIDVNNNIIDALRYAYEDDAILAPAFF